MPQYAVGPQVTQVWAGTGPVLLANQDVTNAVTVGRHSNIGIGGANGDIIPALGSVAYAGRGPLYAIAAAGTTALLVIPDGTQWAPSPGQVAAQINALGLMTDTTGQAINTAVNNVPGTIATTGAPLLNLRNVLLNLTAQVITAGSTFTASTITGITQPSFNLHITATSSGAATSPWFTVKLNWIDTATGLVVQIDSFTSIMSDTASALTTVISGPTDADSLQVTITNNDTQSMTVNQLFAFMSSRPNYTYDYYYNFWTSAAMPDIVGYQVGASASFPTNRVLFDLSRSVGVGVTTTPRFMLPSYAGNSYIHFDGTGSNQWDVVFFNEVTGTIIYRLVTAGSAISNGSLIIPRMPVSCQFTNNGSISGSMNCEVTAI